MSDNLRSLRRQWIITAGLWGVVWQVFYLLLRPAWPSSGRWLMLAGVALVYGLWILWRGLPANHRPDEPTQLPTLGPGNALTLLRGLCIGLLAGFLFGPWPMGALAWVIVLLYTVTDIADYFDGYLARRANHVTVLGGILDMEFDGLGTLVVILLAVSFGQLPAWYLGLGLARYLFIFGLWLRRRLGHPIHEMPPSTHRRVFAGLQMGFLSVVLWPILPRPMAVIAGTLFAAATGAGFLRDWLVVSGTLDPASGRYRRVQRLLYRLLATFLPPMWRLALLVSMGSILWNAAMPFPPAAWRDLIASWGVPGAAVLSGIIALIALIGAPLVGLGVLPRLVSVALSLPIGFDIATRGLLWDNALALISIIFVMLFGSGPLAAWPAEDRFLMQRLGDQ